jgi:hypothetical protein
MRIKTVAGTGIASICGLALAAAPSAGAGASAAGNQAAATKSVTAAFTTLFNAKDTNKAAKEALLEDSSSYKGAFNKLFDSKVAKANPTSAQVTNVTFPTAAACESAVSVSKCAAVTYNLDSAKTGASLLPNVSGYATEVKGHWLVSDTTFCALAKLGGAAC